LYEEENECSDDEEEHLISAEIKTEKQARLPGNGGCTTSEVDEKHFLCETCSVTVHGINSWRKHTRKHISSFRCFKCSKPYKRIGVLRARETKCQISEPNGQFKCRHCPEIFYTYTHLYHHVVVNHPLRNPVAQTDGNIARKDRVDEAKKNENVFMFCLHINGNTKIHLALVSQETTILYLHVRNDE